MESMRLRVLGIVVSCLAPVLVRALYLVLFPNNRAWREMRFQFRILALSLFASIGLFALTRKSNFSNFEFMFMLLFIGAIAGMLHFSFCATFRREDETPPSLIRPLVALICVFFVGAADLSTVYFAGHLDRQLIARSLEDAQGSELRFVPISVELAYYNGREYFQFRTKQTSIIGSRDELLIVNVPVTDETIQEVARIEESVKSKLVMTLVSADVNYFESGRIPVAHASKPKQLQPF